MSITIKNITAADTISSMVDKINFNFDQLLINGGGIEGPRGLEGYPGMQGIQGKQGETGNTGEQGKRGTEFHFLELGDTETEGTVKYYEENGIDLPSDEYAENDIFIAMNGGSSDSLWLLVISDNKLYPERKCDFHETALFEAIPADGENKLIRTLKGEYTNGLVLNDYNCGLNPSPEIIDEIVNNKVAIVYTEELGENDSQGSPNCGIVFYKDGNNEQNAISLSPRINYIVSSNNEINQLNITAPNQGLCIKAKDNVELHSDEGLLSFKINEGDGNGFELYGKNSSTNEKESFLTVDYDTSSSALYIGASDIVITDSINKLLRIKSENVDSCNIILAKDKTYIASDKLFTIGKSGLEESYMDNYYNQARIILNNNNEEAQTELIGKEIKIGANPENESENNFGLYLKNNKELLYSNNQYNEFCKIELNTENQYKQQINLINTYPGTTEISNLSEEYEGTIINYTDETITYDSSNIFYMSPMNDEIKIVGVNRYAHCNFYNNLALRNINNMGAVHGGIIVFEGKYENMSQNPVYDKLMYNFIRIGNTVNCKFSGIIDRNKMHVKHQAGDNVSYESLNNGESWYNSNIASCDVDWPEGVYLNQIYLYLYPPVIKIRKNNNILSTGIKNFTGHLICSMDNNIYEKSLAYEDIITTNGSYNKIPHILISDMVNSNNPMPITYSDFLLQRDSYYAEIFGEFSYILEGTEQHHSGITLENNGSMIFNPLTPEVGQ